MPSRPEKRREHQRTLYKTNRAVVNAYKTARGCMDCGYNLHPAALDFDHRDPSEKKFNIGAAMHTSTSRVLAEIEKCDVVCANCHRIRTHVKKQYGREPIY